MPAGLEPETEPGIASAEGGLVFLDGPDGIAKTMTADAAARTGQSLIDAAAIAEAQRANGDV
ncbi:hypothetical protein AN936_05520 [Sphingopyxis macrogoltabida]|uniref:Uncharacterized protein n=1 Tax=Sphingopyxis macrogoltabida TaxID=33050 RepID=A0A0N9V6S4_SPHMC|nr:hypothetical protein AN936_05520 [Sphingopyxis macrogoltabida]